MRAVPYAVLLAFLLAVPARACNVPVFRYALERWPADRYEVTVFHRGHHEPPPGAVALRGDRSSGDAAAVLARGEWDVVVDTWTGAPSADTHAMSSWGRRCSRAFSGPVSGPWTPRAGLVGRMRSERSLALVASLKPFPTRPQMFFAEAQAVAPAWTCLSRWETKSSTSSRVMLATARKPHRSPTHFFQRL